MRYTPIALVVLLSCTTVVSAAPSPADKAVRAKSLKADLRRSAPLPKWAQPLAEIPKTERTDAAVLRLYETQAFAGDQPAYLVNQAIQVNDRSALSIIGQVSLTYYADYQSMSLHRVAIMRDGKVLDRTASVDARVLQRETAIEQGMYGGVSTIQLLLEDVRVGDTLWLTYSVAGANPVFGKQWFGEYSWDQWLPLERRRLVVLYPKDRKPAWRQLGDFRSDKLTPRVESSGPYEVLTFEGNSIDALDEEPSIASDYLPARSLQFSEFPDWASVARWASGLFPQPGSNAALKAQADQFRKHATPTARAAAALHWVQDEIRYFSVSIGENSHKPQSPATVLKRRYGDCKDKSYLLISLLGELGIQARPVLLSAAAPSIPAKVGPSPGWFDHVIVEIQIDGKRYYVDPTRTGQQVALETLSTAFPGASVLVVDPATTALTLLPERSQHVPSYEVIETITVADHSGDAAMEMREIFRSELAEVSRQRFAALSPLELKKSALRDYEKRYPGVVLLDAPVVADDKQTNQLELRARYRLPKAINVADGAQSIEYQVRPLEGVMALPDKLVRSFPLAMPAALFHGRYRLNIQWPDDVHANESPWSRFIDNRFFQAHESYVFRGNHVNHMVDYRAKVRTVAAAEVQELHKEAKQLDQLAHGRFSALAQNKIGKEASGFSARDVDLVRMAAAASELALELEKSDDSAIPRDKACLLLHAARAGDGILPAAGQKVLARARRLIKEDSRDPAAGACRARQAFEAGDYAASVQMYQSLRDHLASKEPEELRNLAWALLHRGQADQALATMLQYEESQKKAGTRKGAELVIADRIALLQRGGRPVPPELLQYAGHTPDGPWPRPLLAMQAGLLGEDGLIKLVQAMPERGRAHALTETFFYIAQHRLASGDKAGAVTAFRELEKTGIRSSPLYLQGMVELRSLTEMKSTALEAQNAAKAGNFELALRYLNEGVKAGDPKAQFGMGLAYQYGWGLGADPARAAEWFQKAADGGDAMAYFALSGLYRFGKGVPKDEAKSNTLLRTSAELGYAPAMALVGWRYFEGDGQAKDPSYAALWFQRAAIRGDASGQYGLGVTLYRSQGEARDLKTAAALYRAAAEQGNDTAQLDLGYLYEKGEGVAKDLGEAVRWYRKSAEQGNAIAQNNLGTLYQYGKGVAVDEKAAISWYRKSADQGHAEAMMSYGYLLENAKTVKTDAAEAHRWYLKAAELDNPIAQYNLAKQYEVGRGVGADPVQAFKWYLRAAKHGDLDAMTYLGTALQDGIGVERDMKEALRWLTAAAEGGDAIGTLRLGIMYFKGNGIAPDYDRAYKLFEQASAKGQEVANYWLGRIYENGLGRAKDETRARELYFKAGALPEALIRHAVMSTQGRGGPRDSVSFDLVLTAWTLTGDVESLDKLAREFNENFDGARTQQVYQSLLKLAETAGHRELIRTSLGALADSYARYMRPLDAEPHYQRLLGMKEKDFGPQHAKVADTLDDLASIYTQTARLALAESASRRALALRAAQQEKADSKLLYSQRMLAAAVGARGDLAAARGYLAEAQSLAEKGSAQAPAELASELAYIGQQYYDLGEYADAEILFRRALSLVEPNSGAEDRLAFPLNGLAWTLAARGDHAGAERLFRRLLAVLEKRHGNEHHSYAAALGGLGLQLSKLDRHAEAERVLQQGLKLREAYLGKFDAEAAIALHQVGVGFARQGKLAEAEAAFKKALALREGVYATDHVEIAESLHELGALYLSRQRFAQAAPLLQRALAIRKQLMPVHPDLRANEALVAELHKKTGRL